MGHFEDGEQDKDEHHKDHQHLQDGGNSESEGAKRGEDCGDIRQQGHGLSSFLLQRYQEESKCTVGVCGICGVCQAGNCFTGITEDTTN